ncbi:MAG: type VI secretion system-associated lipoprotein [Geobacteraceae bacterium GWC2_58_44]|nr:MAG: type VI secretion system-associated lipoprotein [Geobacteraceae bacterium GWC2_58_44]HBG06208.1 type VI secretion system lipoprotein TssJ [Geobacter sp.]
MIFVIRITSCLFAASLLAACSSSTPLVKQPPEWGYEKDAIQLHLVSDPQLNLYQKKPHSLIVCLYHLREPNGFKQLINEKDGLPRLLECSRFDPSVTYSRRLVVQPNQELTEALDRTDGAKFVGIVAGYYTLRKESSARLFSVPVTEVKNGSTLVQKTAKLNIDLYLDRQEIKQPNENAKATAPIKGKETK